MRFRQHLIAPHSSADPDSKVAANAWRDVLTVPECFGLKPNEVPGPSELPTPRVHVSTVVPCPSGIRLEGKVLNL